MYIKHLASWPEYHQAKYMTEAENTITIIYIPFPAESFFSLLCLSAFWSLVLILLPLLILLSSAHWKVDFSSAIYLIAFHIYC